MNFLPPFRSLLARLVLPCLMCDEVAHTVILASLFLCFWPLTLAQFCKSSLD